MFINLLGCLLFASISFAIPEQFSVPYTTIKGDGWASNLLWQLGSKQTIAWNTTLSTYNITLWQQSVLQNKAKQAASPALQLVNSPGVNSKEWIVDIKDLDLDDSPVFLLWLNFTGAAPNGFTSPYFNITRNAVTSASTLRTTSTSTATSETSSSTASGRQSAEPATQSSNVSDTGLSSGAKVGLGVGLGIGIPFLILLGALIVVQSCRLSRANSKIKELPTTLLYSQEEKLQMTPPSMMYEAPESGHMPGGKYHPVELDSTWQTQSRP